MKKIILVSQAALRTENVKTGVRLLISICVECTITLLDHSIKSNRSWGQERQQAGAERVHSGWCFALGTGGKESEWPLIWMAIVFEARILRYI